MTRLSLASPSFRSELLAREGEKSSVSISGPYGVHDNIRHGLHSIAHNLAACHPLQKQLEPISQEHEKRKCNLGSQSLGSHLPLRFQMEKAILKECSRLHGLPSSHLGLAILNGTEDSIEICDILNGNSVGPGFFYNSAIRLSRHYHMPRVYLVPPC